VTGPAGQARARQVELILDRLVSLPTLSAVATKLLSAGSQEEIDIPELARLIEADPSLTGKVLSLCRRADKGLGDRITGVAHAITLLGLDAVTSAVLSVEVFDTLRSPGSAGASGFDAQGHWRHAIAVACASELIASAHGGKPCKPETAFVGGLLHSIGRMALEIALPGAYGKVLRVAEHRGSDSAALERELIGLDHAAAGRRLAEHWGLPKALRDVAWLHGMPVPSLPEGPHRGLVSVVATGRALCRRLNLGWSGDFGPLPDVGEYAKAAGLDRQRVQGVVRELADRVAERCGALGLDDLSGPDLLLESVLRANGRLAQLNQSLEQRSRHGERQRRVLGAIATFLQPQGREGLTETLAGVCRSACEVLELESASVVMQAGEGEPWVGCRVAGTGEARMVALEAPRGAGGEAQDLGWLCRGSSQRARTGAVLPWARSQLGESSGVSVCVLPTVSGAAVLVLGVELAESVPSEVQRRALLAAWGSAMSAAVRDREGERLSVELAQRHAELAEAQARLAEAGAMAKLGEMTAGAAHEMNNPLTVIKGYGQVLRRRAKESALREPAEKIAEAAQQLSDLITGLHLLAAPPEPSKGRVVLVDVLNEAVQYARERTRQSVSVRMAVPEHMPPVYADGAMLSRALSELLTNAAEADTSEILEIRVQTDPLDDRLMIVVRDRGRGMTAHELAHAFDPFFSSRPAGRGTGLGLSRARRLVELMGGTVTLASEHGAGTRATVTLPGWRGETLGQADLEQAA
jgi:signal transduction histidine kinase/HD-like signal output (HDOD) protein